MNVLHLVSNFRWTERAEPAADLTLGQQALGVRAELVCGRQRLLWEDSIECQAAIKGLQPRVLDFPKHFALSAAWRDIRSLVDWIRTERIDVLHTHLPNAHLMATMARARVRQKPLMVHSVYEPDGASLNFRSRWISAPRTDGWVVISDGAAAALQERYAVEADRVLTLVPPVDVERFRHSPLDAPRQSFGLASESFVVGAVMRLGVNRGIHVLIHAVALVKDRCPDLQCLIVGRGDIENAVERPARQLGIRDRITLGGYCRRDKLVAAYHAMDVFAYLKPGTDQSCRAVREAMAAGLPVVASRVGFLPELVDEGETGHLFDPQPEALAVVLERLYRDREAVRRLGEQAGAHAREQFAPQKQARRVTEFYARLGACRGSA
jgi:glycosyltransferase involved in cell wall biosynthesis